jgi:uncharacterized phage protein (TIGR01671 family)
MMREIKFRGKRIDTGEWVYGYLCFVYVDVPSKASIYDPKSARSYDVLTETIGQYAGQKDKNVKEVYEGDILRITGRYFRKSIQEDMTVEYDESRSWFGVLDMLHTVSLNTFDFEDDVEVIGTIHDNKELTECATEAK